MEKEPFMWKKPNFFPTIPFVIFFFFALWKF